MGIDNKPLSARLANEELIGGVIEVVGVIVDGVINSSPEVVKVVDGGVVLLKMFGSVVGSVVGDYIILGLVPVYVDGFVVPPTITTTVGLTGA